MSERPSSEHPSSEHPSSEHPSSEHPSSGRPSSGRPIAVLLAGGRGSRLWPLTSSCRPKPCVEVAGRALFTRALQLVPDAEVLLCGARSMLASIAAIAPGLDETRWIVESSARGTGVAVALAARTVQERFGDRPMVILPADLWTDDPEALERATREALTRAAEGHLVSLGVRADRGDAGLGYMELSSPMPDGSFELGHYIEKPPVAQATELAASGRYAWNVGVFAWRPSAILSAIARCAPELVASPGPPLPSIDDTVLAKLRDAGIAQRVVLAAAHFRDLGTLEAIGGRQLAEPPWSLVVEGDARVVLTRSGDLVVADDAALRALQTLAADRPSLADEGLTRVVLAGAVSAEVKVVGTQVEVRTEVAAVAADRIVFASTREDASELAARFVVDRLKATLGARGRANLVVSAGRSPAALYARLVAMREALPWDRVRIGAMDDLPSSCFADLVRRTLIEPLGAREGWVLDSATKARAVERFLFDDGIDFVVHGVGPNGHLALCEPEADPDAPSGEVALSSATREALSAWIDDVPHVGITLSRRVLRTAPSAVLLAFGKEKARALEALLASESSALPVADLRAQRDLWIACDLAALGGRLA